MTATTAIKELQDFARANYEDGGHWVYESFDCADYQEVLDLSDAPLGPPPAGAASAR